jgi:hypothetical protein
LIGRDVKYKPNQAILKKYNDEKYKLTLFKSLRTCGVEDDEFERPEKGSINDEKLENNISRARAKIFELADCNHWDYFATFTIDGTKYNRSELNTYHRAFTLWITYLNKKFDCNIKYMTIPEKHEKGGWHEHGLISGIPKELLRLFTLNERLPKYIREKLKKGDEVYNMPLYAQKFGF